MAGGLSMAGSLLFPFHSYDKLFWVSVYGYYNNWFYTVIPQVTARMRLQFSPEITVAY